MSKTVLYRESTQNSQAKLTVFDSGGNAGCFWIRNGIRIGRQRAESVCEVQIPSAIVSRNQGEIFLLEGKYYYRNLDSTNGTYINNVLYGTRTGKVVCELKDGDVIAVDLRQGEQQHPEAVFGIFSLSDTSYDGTNEILLSDVIAELQIGRTVQNGLKLENPMISQLHASFFQTQNGWAIIDHKSTNGVYLNGKRISSPRYLAMFDVVRIVNTVFIFCGNKIVCAGGSVLNHTIVDSERNVEQKEETQKPADLVIEIVERSVVQRFKKMMLLQNIHMSISNGEMVLILGGSGAGKTTFINAVMGYEKANGKIVYNDTDIYEEYEQMKYEIGFVPQQDLLRGSDTVYDTLANAAEIKLPRRIRTEQREEKILDVLNLFGLSREKDSLVSKLSGGQRKRLSIAVEFIANPSLFFLDEPDSGIDDVMGRGLMETLRELQISVRLLWLLLIVRKGLRICLIKSLYWQRVQRTIAVILLFTAV